MSALQPQRWHLHSKVTSGRLDWMKSILHQLIIQYLKILCSILYHRSMPLKINIGLFWMSISIRMKSSIIPSRSWWCPGNFHYREEIFDSSDFIAAHSPNSSIQHTTKNSTIREIFQQKLTIFPSILDEDCIVDSEDTQFEILSNKCTNPFEISLKIVSSVKNVATRFFIN